MEKMIFKGWKSCWKIFTAGRISGLQFFDRYCWHFRSWVTGNGIDAVAFGLLAHHALQRIVQTILVASRTQKRALELGIHRLKSLVMIQRTSWPKKGEKKMKFSKNVIAVNEIIRLAYHTSFCARRNDPEMAVPQISVHLRSTNSSIFKGSIKMMKKKINLISCFNKKCNCIDFMIQLTKIPEYNEPVRIIHPRHTGAGLPSSPESRLPCACPNRPVSECNSYRLQMFNLAYFFSTNWTFWQCQKKGKFRLTALAGRLLILNRLASQTRTTNARGWTQSRTSHHTSLAKTQIRYTIFTTVTDIRIWQKNTIVSFVLGQTSLVQLWASLSLDVFLRISFFFRKFINYGEKKIMSR